MLRLWPGRRHTGITATKENVMEARLNPFAHDTLMTILPHVISAGRAASGALPERVAELVNIRASQINGCGERIIRTLGCQSGLSPARMP